VSRISLHVNRGKGDALMPLSVDEHPDIAAALEAVDLTSLSGDREP
jgi:hypothetical protein